MSVRSMVGVAVVVMLSGCAPSAGSGIRPGVAVIPPEHGVGGQPTTSAGPRKTTAEMPVFRKRVEAKEDPSILIARDRTKCAVSEDRYKKIKVGDNVTCAWRTDI